MNQQYSDNEAGFQLPGRDESATEGSERSESGKRQTPSSAFAEAAVTLASAGTLKALLQETARHARFITGAGQAVASLCTEDEAPMQAISISSGDAITPSSPEQSGMKFFRLPVEQESRDPAGWLSLPLKNGDGKTIGLVQLTDKPDGFSAQDEANLRHLIALVSVLVEKQRDIEKLQENEARLLAVVEASPACISIVNPQGGLLYMNQSGLDMLGVDELATALNLPMRDFVVPEHRDEWDENNRRVCAGERMNWEYDIVSQNGERRNLVTHAIPIVDARGRTSHLGVTRDVTEEKKVIRALRTSERATRIYAAKLERSNKELESFITMAAHDLQAPLRKIRMFADHLETVTGDELNETATNDLDRLQYAAERMQTLITDLLMLSRITRKGKDFEPVNLTEIATDALEDFDEDIREKNAKITVGELGTVYADRSQVCQLFHNLLDNSLKFSRPDVPPVIEISAWFKPEGYSEIRIKDNGIGIEEKYAEKVFQIFQCLHGETEYPGTGIGLTICKKIVERHNGSIRVETPEDDQPVEGTTIVIRLPVKQPV